MLKLKGSDPEYLRRVYEERGCIICKRKFYVLKKGKGMRKSRSFIRTRGAKTCSRDCSRKWNAEKRISSSKQGRL